jgi:hypothetical protein
MEKIGFLHLFLPPKKVYIQQKEIQIIFNTLIDEREKGRMLKFIMFNPWIT